MEGWRIVRASVIGTSHLERGVECQDYCDHKEIPTSDGTILVAVVSDGAGSASNGAEGAELACTQFVSEVETFLMDGKTIEDLDSKFGQLWLSYVQQRIGDLAEAAQKSTRDYACTFLAAVLSDESAVFYQIGDGAIVYSPAHRPDSYFWGVVPHEGMYANTTDFITDNSAQEKLQHEFLSVPVKNLAMFTDGIQSLAIDYSGGIPGVPHGPFLRPMLAPLRAGADLGDINDKLQIFLASPNINQRTDDDKTMILVSRDIAVAEEIGQSATDGDL